MQQDRQAVNLRPSRHVHVVPLYLHPFKTTLLVEAVQLCVWPALRKIGGHIPPAGRAEIASPIFWLSLPSQAFHCQLG